MELTIILTTYNWPESLLLALHSIEKQTTLPSEVIIADDGSDFKTEKLVTKYKKKSKLKIIHSWQKDIGFRVARSRNLAVLKSTGDYIILIDGDMILHPNFVKDHVVNAEEGFFVQGSRVFLSEKQTKNVIKENKINFSFFSPGLKNRKNSIHSNFFSRVFSRKNNSLKSIKSCNMGFFKEDFLKINGFNNDFEGWGREDSEFIVRMYNSGIYRKNIHFNAIQFHLWHKESSRSLMAKNNIILNDSINNVSKWCENGINSVERNES